MLDRNDLARVFVSGPPGPAGESAYQVWLSQGNVGSKKVFLDSLKAKDGRDGQPGAGTIVTRIAAVALLASTAVVSLDGVTCVPADPTDPAHFGKVIGLVAAPTAQGAFATAMTFGPLSGIAGEFTAGDALYIADGAGAVHKGGLSRIRPSAPGWFQAVGCALSASDVTFQLGGFASRQSEGAPDLAGSRVFFDRGAGTDSSDATEFVNGVLITPAGGVAGSRLSDLARRVLSPYDFLAVSDAVIHSDKTATASRSAAANTILLQNYFNYCRDYRIPWVLPYGNWLVDAGIKAYGPGIAYGKILAPNDGRVQPGLNEVWGAAFTHMPYPEDVLAPPTLAEVKAWTGVKRGSPRIGGLIGRKDQYITVLTTDQILVDRRDKDNTAEGVTTFVAPPMNLGEGFLVTSDDGQISYPLIEDWQTATWTEANTTITAQRVREPIEVTLPDVVLIGPAFINSADLQGRRSGIQETCCNVNYRGGSVRNLIPSVPPLQGVSRTNCCKVTQTGLTVFDLGSLSTQYGLMQNLTAGIKDVDCSAYGCRRGWDCTRGKYPEVEGGFYPDGMGSHYHTGAIIRNVSHISCRTTQNPVPLNFAGGALTMENCKVVVPPGFNRAFQMRADLWKWIGKIHFKGNEFFFDAGDAATVTFLNLQGPARPTAYNTGLTTEMFDSLIVDRSNKIRVGGTKSDGTKSNARLQVAIIFNDWDDIQGEQIVGGHIYLAPQVAFDNPDPLPGRTLPPDPTDMDAPPVVIGAGFPKCKINYVNFRRSIGGNYDMVVEGLPDLHVEILCDRAGPKAAGRVNLDVKGVRGQKLISTTYGGTRKTYIQTRENETVTFETPGFASGFLPVGEENPNRTYDETQPPAVYGGDVTTAKATVDGATALLPDLFGGRAYATPLTRAAGLVANIPAAVQSFTTLGYAAPGDNGGADYVRAASNYALTALDFTSADGAKWRNAAKELTPQMAGAKADGVTDDRNAIRNCLVVGGGRPVRLIGTYLCDSTISIPSGSVILAEKGKGTLKTGADFGIFNSDLRSDVTIRGVTFLGRSDAPVGRNMVAFTHATRCVLEDCVFKDHRSPAFIFYLGCSYCGMRGGRIENCGYHTAVDNVSYSAHFSEMDAGLTVEEGRDRNHSNFFENVELVNTAGTGISLQSGMIISGIRAFSDNMIGLASNLYITRTRDTLIADSDFDMGPHSGNALDTYVNDGLRVDGVRVYNSGAGGLLLGNAQNATVTNFHAFDCWSSKGLTYDPVYGIGESVHQGGIVLVTDSYGSSPGDEPGRNVLRNITISGAKLGNRKSPGTQRWGVHVVPGTDYDDTVRIDEDVKFIGNTDGDFSAFIASTNGLIPATRGQLQYVSTTQVALKRWAGLHIWINGANRPIPSAGVTFSNANVVAGAIWYAYVYMSGSTMLGEISATVHVEHASGVRVKNGDPTRTLVGFGLGDTGNLFAHSATKRLVRSYFNRVVQSLSSTYVNGTTMSPTAVDISTGFTVQFCSWADEMVDITFVGDVSNPGGTTYTLCGVDGVNFGGLQRGTGNNVSPVSPRGLALRTEGAHTATLRGYVSAGTGTWTGQIMGRIG